MTASCHSCHRFKNFKVCMSKMCPKMSKYIMNKRHIIQIGKVRWWVKIVSFVPLCSMTLLTTFLVFLYWKVSKTCVSKYKARYKIIKVLSSGKGKRVATCSVRWGPSPESSMNKNVVNPILTSHYFDHIDLV